MQVIAGKAVCLVEALKPEFKEYGRRIVKMPPRLRRLMKRGVKLSATVRNHLIWWI